MQMYFTCLLHVLYILLDPVQSGIPAGLQKMGIKCIKELHTKDSKSYSGKAREQIFGCRDLTVSFYHDVSQVLINIVVLK